MVTTRWKPDFTNKINPYEGVTSEYISRIRGTQAYKTAVEKGWISDVEPPKVEPPEEVTPIQPEIPPVVQPAVQPAVQPVTPPEVRREPGAPEVGLSIEELARQFNIPASRFVTAEMLSDLALPAEQRRVQWRIPYEQYLTSEQARTIGIQVPEGSVVRMSPLSEGEPTFTLLPSEEARVSPELTRMLRTIYPERFVAPSFGFTEEQKPAMILDQIIRELQTDYQGLYSDLTDRIGEDEAARFLKEVGVAEEYILSAMSFERQNDRINETVQAVFPDYEIPDLVSQLTTDFEGFITDIQTESAASWRDKRILLEQLGFEPVEVNEILRYRRTVLPIDGIRQLVTVDVNTESAFDADGDYVGKYSYATRTFTATSEKNWFQQQWDTFAFFSNQYAESFYGGTLSSLSLLYPDWEFLGEDIRQKNKEARQQFQNVYSSIKRDYDEWTLKHPEQKPSAIYMEGALKNPELLKDPNYWVHETVSILPFLLASIGTTVATGGVGASYVVMSTLGMGAVEAGSVYEDLINSGASPEQAAGISTIAGGIIGGLESVGRIPLLKQVSPALFGQFKKRAVSELARRGRAEAIKRFGVNFTTVQFSEVVTEIAQEIVGNVAVGFFDENRSVLENVPDIAVKTAVATAPLALIGAGTSSIRMVSPSELSGLSDLAKRAEGWIQDKKGNWFETIRGEEGFARLPGEKPEEITPEPIEHRGTDPEGISIADELGVRLDKASEIVPEGFLFTDVQQTGGTFATRGRTLEEARAELTQMRQEFAEKAIPPEVTPPVTPEVAKPIVHRGTEPEGIAIADELGIAYDGIQEGIDELPTRMQFTDPVTGSTFYANTVEEARTNLANMREKFGVPVAELGIPDVVTPPVTESIGGLNVGDWVQFMPEGTMYQITKKTKTRVTLVDGEGNISTIPIRQQVYPLEIRPEAVIPLETEEQKAEITKQMTEKPIETLPDVTEAEAFENLTTPGRPKYTMKQLDALNVVFADYIIQPSTLTAWQLTRELRRETLAGRAQDLKARAQQLMVKEGLTSEQALNQAEAALAGPLPAVTSEYIKGLTEDMRDSLFAKLYLVLKNEPFEMASTHTALTNALRGKPIPREPGVRGGSAYTRLLRVYGDQPEVFRAIEKVAEEKKPLEDIIEGVFHETGREPIPVDEATAEYLRNLAAAPLGQAWLTQDVPTLLRLTDPKTPEQVRAETEDLRITLAKAPIPVTPFEAPIEDAIKQLPLVPRPVMDSVVQVLKEIGMSPVDIGGTIRAHKSSFDQSYIRQVGPLIPAHPVRFALSFVDAWKGLFSQKSVEALRERTIRDPDEPMLYEIYDQLQVKDGRDFLRPWEIVQRGTAQHKGLEELGYLTEERLIPRWTAKLPYLKVFGRGFISGTNSMTWGVFKDFYRSQLRISEKYASGELTLRPGESFDIMANMDAYAVYLAERTGRAGLGRLQNFGPALGNILYAPRYALGQIKAPRHLFSANPYVRKEAWKDAVMWVGTIGGLLVLGSTLDWWDVELDRNSADFGKARIGNLHLDFWSGSQQFFVFFSRLYDILTAPITGETPMAKSSVTGAEYSLTIDSLVNNMVETKLAPIMSLFREYATGEVYGGEPLDVEDVGQWLNRVGPMTIVDIYEAIMEESTTSPLAGILSFFGFGVQTYTGDWKENFAKLGLPKYPENMAYGLTEPYYDTQDFYSDHSSQFTGVDPETLTEEKGYPNYIRSVAETKIIKKEMSVIPNERLVSINADPSKGSTFADYYQMWRDREKVVASEDEDALIEFDKKYPQAELGNFSQRQFALLNEYWSITNEQEQKDFLEENEAEIGTNLRQDWLRSHHKENAELAVWGQAKILSEEAYTQFISRINELDIPDNALPEDTLPPKESVPDYFEYQLMENKMSWEAQLLLANDDELRLFLERNPIDTPIESLELKVENRDHFDAYDELETDEEREQYRLDNPEFVDDTRRIAAIENGGLDYQEDWVARGKVIDEFTAGSSEAKVWLVDHQEIWDWALTNELLTDDGKDWNIPVLRINTEFRENDNEYNAIPGDDRLARGAYLENNMEYRLARRRRDAYQLSNKLTGERFPEGQIENYVGYYEIEESGYRRERFLVDNPAFADAMHNIAGIDILKPQDIPSVEYDNLTEEWLEDFNKYKGLSDNESEFYIEDTGSREAERESMKYITGSGEFSDIPFSVTKKTTGFGMASLTRDAHYKLRSLQGEPGYQQYVNDYVQYYKLQGEGKPPNWKEKTGTDEWYEDDWFLMENMDYYGDIYKGILENEKRDFRKVPSREVFGKYLHYLSLKYATGKPKDRERFDYRWINKDLESWFVDVKDYTPVSEQKRKEFSTRSDRLNEEIEKMFERLQSR